MERICRERRAASVMGSLFWKSILLLSLTLIPLSMLNLFPAYGAEYPTKAIEMILPVAPGGGLDMVSRILSSKLSVLLGQPVVVVNKPGGGTVLGVQSVASAKPDGYTILCSVPLNLITVPLVTKGIDYTLKDFAPIYLATATPSVILVKKDAPWKTLEELVAEAKRSPGKLTFASGPQGGSTGYFSGELFKISTATDITNVPIGAGEGQAVITLLGGHVNMTFSPWGLVREHLSTGSLRALAVMSDMRLKDFLPDVPTTVEKGYPKIVAITYTGYFAPAKTPSPVVRRLSQAFREAVEDKEIAEKLVKMDPVVLRLSPEEVAKYIVAEEEKWSDVVRVLGLGRK